MNRRVTRGVWVHHPRDARRSHLPVLDFDGDRLGRMSSFRVYRIRQAALLSNSEVQSVLCVWTAR